MGKSVRLLVVLSLITALVGFIRRHQVGDPPPSGTATWEPLVGEPRGTTTETAPTGTSWAEPIDGACPPGFPIKAKLASKIFHVEGGLSYERTNPDHCYPTASAAEADGFRAAKR